MINVQQILDDTEGFGVIYMLTSPSGKSYIGQSVVFKERYSTYKRRKKNSIGRKLYNALNKYNGIENFEIKILCKLSLIEDLLVLKEQLDELEKFYIKTYSTFNLGYNSTIGGEGSLGRITTEETKLKIGKANKGKRAVADIITKCTECEAEIKLQPWLYRLRTKRSKDRRIYCSYACRDANRFKKKAT